MRGVTEAKHHAKKNVLTFRRSDKEPALLSKSTAKLTRNDRSNYPCSKALEVRASIFPHENLF